MAHVREVPRKSGIAYEVRWRGSTGKFQQRTFTVKREAERFALKVENDIADGQSTDALVKNSKTFREVAELMQAAHAHTLKPKTRRDNAATYELTFLAPEQVAAIVERLDDSAPDGLIVQFAAYTGLRAGELEGLRIGDVNLFARQPHVRVQRQAQYTPKVGWECITPKSNKSIRNVPLEPALADRLRDYLEHHPHRHDRDAMLWPGRRRGGHGQSRGALDYSLQFNHDNLYRKHFLPALAELGIPAVRWHDLRHFYASACAAGGIPIERAAAYMGHADIATMYKHYLHLFDGSQTDDMNLLAAVAARPATRLIILAR
ncbi:site-specific integrase [Agromyces sp. ZXT2-3]|uniref:site-specific integrase n=1 Tax=Agromyces sp. ZXT2-3 TaxID=3461152 RepID=UPI004054BA8E